MLGSEMRSIADASVDFSPAAASADAAASKAAETAAVTAFDAVRDENGTLVVPPTYVTVAAEVDSGKQLGEVDLAEHVRSAVVVHDVAPR